MKVEAACRYFTVLSGAGDRVLDCGADSFHALTVTGGEGEIGGLPARKGDTFFVPAGYGKYAARGVTYLLTRI